MIPFWSREVEGNDPLFLLGVDTGSKTHDVTVALKQAFKTVLFIPESELPRMTIQKRTPNLVTLEEVPENMCFNKFSQLVHMHTAV